MSTPTIQEAIKQYLAEHVTARNLAPLTRLSYASDLKLVHRWLTEQQATLRATLVGDLFHLVVGFCGFKLPDNRVPTKT
jgi:site-specific recombinase XerD